LGTFTLPSPPQSLHRRSGLSGAYGPYSHTTFKIWRNCFFRGLSLFSFYAFFRFDSQLVRTPSPGPQDLTHFADPASVPHQCDVRDFRQVRFFFFLTSPPPRFSSSLGFFPFPRDRGLDFVSPFSPLLSAPGSPCPAPPFEFRNRGGHSRPPPQIFPFDFPSCFW